MHGQKGFELQTWARDTLSVHQDGVSNAQSVASRDEHDLLRLGKKPVLRRNFGFMSILGFQCTVLITWEGILVVFTQSLINGGPAGVIWGFIIVWIGTLSTFTVIAELASMSPTAGGQYHWVSLLAPESSRTFLTYVTAWLTVWGWQATTASAAYLIGTLIQGLVILTHDTYIPQAYQSMLFLWAVLAFAVFINTVASRTLASFEGTILVLHLFGFIAVLIPLVYLGPHGDGSVFTSFINEGNWSTQALSFFVGLPGSVFSLIGADSAVHMSEEIKNASTLVPRALVSSVVINGALGLGMVIAVFLRMGNVDDALNAKHTLGFPFLEIFQQATNSVVGSYLMGVVVAILGVCSTVSALASSSRMMWALARDRGVPFWRIFVKLQSRTSIPIYTVAFTTLISMLLSLIPLGSAVAFNDIVSLTVAGLYASYLICCVLLLWRRLRGDINPFDDSLPFLRRGGLQWGRWKVPGVIGVCNNAFACVYLLLVWFWSFWPPQTPVTASTMNFSVVMFGGVMLIGVLWYLFVGRKEFSGPTEEVELLEHDR